MTRSLFRRRRDDARHRLQAATSRDNSRIVPLAHQGRSQDITRRRCQPPPNASESIGSTCPFWGEFECGPERVAGREAEERAMVAVLAVNVHSCLLGFANVPEYRQRYSSGSADARAARQKSKLPSRWRRSTPNLSAFSRSYSSCFIAPGISGSSSPNSRSRRSSR